MNEMVERVAKAVIQRRMERLGFGFTGKPTENELDEARAAIAAMREPTQVMIAEIENAAEERFQAAPSFQRFYGDYLWRAGIDAALAEKEPKE